MTRIRVLSALVALFVASADGVAQSSTTWTGAVSTDWSNSANWTSGLPGSSRDAVLVPAARPCSIGSSQNVACANLLVRPGATLQLDGSLSVHVGMDVETSVLGSGTVYVVAAGAYHDVVLRCRGGASLGSLRSGGPFFVNDLHLYDVHVRGDLTLTSTAHVKLHGTITVGGTFGLFTAPTTGLVSSDADAVLTAFTIDTSWPFAPPPSFQVVFLRISSTSSFTPTGGVLTIPPGGSLNVRFTTGGSLGNVVVPATASLGLQTEFRASGTGGHLSSLDCRGSVLVAVGPEPITIGSTAVSGSLSISDSSGLPLGFAPPIRIASLNVLPGGRVDVLTPSFSTPSGDVTLEIAGSTVVDGEFRLGRGAYVVSPGGFQHNYFGPPAGYPLSSPGSLTVGAGGRLSLVGETAWPARLAGFDIQVGGILGGHDFEILEPAIGGVRLSAGASIATAPDNLRNGRIQSSRAAPAADRLLDLACSTSQSVDGLRLDADGGSNISNGVRATTAVAVVMANATGNRSGQAFEDDPLGVVTWNAATTFLGTGTPGCLPLAVCDANGPPRIGNAGFAFTCRRGHPSGGGILVVGAPLATPLFHLGHICWIDLFQPVISSYFGGQASGDILAPLPIPNDPYLVGLVVAGQFAVLEPPGCTPYGISSSTAMQITVLP